MNIVQLRDRLNNLLAVGVDPTMAVAIPTLVSDDNYLQVSELTAVSVRDNETYQYDSEKMALMHRSGSVVALDFLYNDGWRNESPGVTRVIGADAESIEKYRITVDAFTNSEHRVINIKEFLDIPEFTEDQIERAFDNGWGFVRCKTPFGEYHELLTSRDGSLQMVRTINVGLVYAVDPAVATDKPDEITISDFDKAREL